MALAGLAGLAVVQRFAVVSGVPVLTVLAVASGRVVSTLLADAAASPARPLKHLHAEATLVGMAVALTGEAGIGVRGRGSVPRSVQVEILTDVTVRPRCVMLAHAHCPARVVTATFGGVSVTFTSASDLQV